MKCIEKKCSNEQESNPGGSYQRCRFCLDKLAKGLRDRRAKFLADGACTVCGKSNADASHNLQTPNVKNKFNFKLCFPCRVKHIQYWLNRKKGK